MVGEMGRGQNGVWRVWWEKGGEEVGQACGQEQQKTYSIPLPEPDFPTWVCSDLCQVLLLQAKVAPLQVLGLTPGEGNECLFPQGGLQ